MSVQSGEGDAAPPGSDVIDLLHRVRDEILAGAGPDAAVWRHVLWCFNARATRGVPCAAAEAGEGSVWFGGCAATARSAVGVARCVSCRAMDCAVHALGQVLGAALWCGVDMQLSAPQALWSAMVRAPPPLRVCWRVASPRQSARAWQVDSAPPPTADPECARALLAGVHCVAPAGVLTLLSGKEVAAILAGHRPC